MATWDAAEKDYLRELSQRKYSGHEALNYSIAMKQREEVLIALLIAAFIILVFLIWRTWPWLNSFVFQPFTRKVKKARNGFVEWWLHE
jgi:hypothetical protein